MKSLNVRVVALVDLVFQSVCLSIYNTVESLNARVVAWVDVDLVHAVCLHTKIPMSELWHDGLFRPGCLTVT